MDELVSIDFFMLTSGTPSFPKPLYQLDQIFRVSPKAGEGFNGHGITFIHVSVQFGQFRPVPLGSAHLSRYRAGLSRKNFLFAHTPRGAQSNAGIFSLVETEKENKLAPYRYPGWVLQIALSLDRTEVDWAKGLLPEYAPEACSLN